MSTVPVSDEVVETGVVVVEIPLPKRENKISKFSYLLELIPIAIDRHHQHCL